MTTPSAFAPVAITSRSGLDESVHFGAVVGLGSSGGVEFAVGDVTTVVYPRSANKPMQAAALVRAGLRLPPRLLALVCASHDGTPMHTAAASAVLASAGLTAADLCNTPSLPLDPEAAADTLRAGGGPSALAMNCSGKHSGMLATCVCNGWPHDSSYLERDHPLQLAITAVMDELYAEEHAHIGVDGCGAPAHAMSLTGLARAFRAIATGTAGDAGREVYSAMTGHPEMVSGRRRDLAMLMRGLPGLLAKDGAEGVFAAALPDGRAVALKIADGGERARPPVAVAALASLGIDVEEVAPEVEQFILGHGAVVGTVRAVAP
jgi:L-asparaginase II